MSGYHHHEQAKHDRGTTRTIPAQGKGKPAIKFKEGGLHASTGTKSGQKISAAKHAEAKSGALGAKAKRQETFYENILKGRGK